MSGEEITMSFMMRAEQLAKIGYWLVGIVGWMYLILVCQRYLGQGGR